MYNEGFEILVI